MNNELSEKELYEKAKKGFYIHLVFYCLVNILLFVIWILTEAAFPWFIFPLGGWGIGLLFHFLGIFVFTNRKQSQWEKKQIEKEMDQLRNS